MSNLLAVRNLIDAVHRRARDEARRAAFWQKRRGIWEQVSWARYACRVRHAALRLTQLGVDSSARLAITAEPSVHVVCLALAGHGVGASVCFVHPDGPPEELEAQWRAMAVTHVIADLPAQRDWASEVGVLAWLLGDFDTTHAPGDHDEWVLDETCDQRVQSGSFVFPVEQPAGEWLSCAIDAEELARVATALGEQFASRGTKQRGLCQLPFSHPFEWVLGPVLHLLHGGELCFPESPEAVDHDLLQARVSRLTVLGWQLDALAQRARHQLSSGGDRSLSWLEPRAGLAGVLQRGRVWPVLRQALGLANVSQLIGHGPRPEEQTLTLMTQLGLPPLWLDARKVFGARIAASDVQTTDAAVKSLLSVLQGHRLRSRQLCQREEGALWVRIEIDPEAAGQFARERGLSYTTYRSLAALPALQEQFQADLAAPIEALRIQGLSVNVELLRDRPDRGSGGLRPDGSLAPGRDLSHVQRSEHSVVGAA